MSTATQNKTNPRSVIGGIPGLLDEVGFEMEVSPGGILKETTNVALEGVMELLGGIVGVEDKNEKTENKFPSQGSIEFNKNQAKAEAETKKANKDRQFYQTLKDEQLRAQMAKDRLWMEEEINDIASNISTEEKNELLHYQASYKDRSIYQKAELRRKIIEQRRKSEKQAKDASIPSPAKQASALQTAFEGGSGSQGGGTANLSAHATG